MSSEYEPWKERQTSNTQVPWKTLNPDRLLATKPKKKKAGRFMGNFWPEDIHNDEFPEKPLTEEERVHLRDVMDDPDEDDIWGVVLPEMKDHPLQIGCVKLVDQTSAGVKREVEAANQEL